MNKAQVILQRTLFALAALALVAGLGLLCATALFYFAPQTVFSGEYVAPAKDSADVHLAARLAPLGLYLTVGGGVVAKLCGVWERWMKKRDKERAKHEAQAGAEPAK